MNNNLPQKLKSTGNTLNINSTHISKMNRNITVIIVRRIPNVINNIFSDIKLTHYTNFYRNWQNA